MWASKGWGRTLGILLIYVGMVCNTVPVLAPWADVVTAIGTAVGGAGVVNAGVNALVKK